MEIHYLMKKLMLLASLVLSITTLCAQRYLNKSKAVVYKKLNRQSLKASAPAKITTTDATIIYEVNDTAWQKLQETYYFKNNCCYSFTITSSCDSCLKKYLNEVLEQKNSKWQKINDSFYVSSYPYKYLNIVPQNFSYTITSVKRVAYVNAKNTVTLNK